MTDTQQEQGYPFRADLVDKAGVTERAFSTVKEFQGDPRWIVKENDNVMDHEYMEWLGKYERDREKAGMPPKLSLERFKEEMKGADVMLKKFGGELYDFIPEHHFVYGANPEGRRKGFVVMKKVTGEDVIKMDKVPLELVPQLEKLIELSIDFFEKTTEEETYLGFFPDLFPPSQEGSGGDFGNLMWGDVDGKRGLYLVDTYPLDPVESVPMLMVDLQEAMENFERKKGVRFSDGFMENVIDRVSRIKPHGI